MDLTSLARQEKDSQTLLEIPENFYTVASKSRGLFLLPTETLNELMKIKALSQQPTIDSVTRNRHTVSPERSGQGVNLNSKSIGGEVCPKRSDTCG